MPRAGGPAPRAAQGQSTQALTTAASGTIAKTSGRMFFMASDLNGWLLIYMGENAYPAERLRSVKNG